MKITRSRRKRSAERRERRREDRGRHELDQRHDAHGLGAGRLVRVQEEGDPGAVLHGRERDVRELDAAQRRVPEDLSGDAPRRSQPVQQAPHRAQCASARCAHRAAVLAGGRRPGENGRMAILTADELATVRREYRVGVPPARADLPRPGGLRLGAGQHHAARLGRGRAARRSIAEPGSFLVREVLDESVLAGPRPGRRDPRVLQRVPPPGHRGGGARVRHRPSASSAPTTPGSTTSTASSSAPSTPRTSRTSPSRATACAPIRHRDLAGLRVPVLRRRVGDAAAPGAARRPRRPVRAVRLHDAALGAPDHLRGRRQLEVHRRELLASATTARACTRSSTG